MGGLDATHAGHRQVHQHDVGLQRDGRVDGSLAVRCVTDDLDFGAGGEQRPQSVAERLVVVAHEQSDGVHRFRLLQPAPRTAKSR